jgi:hypothetical protein
LVLLLFLKTFREVREVEKSPAIHHFYFKRPAYELFQNILVIQYRIFVSGRSFLNKFGKKDADCR